MKTKKILVLGGNGKTGRRVAERLKRKENVEVRIGSRLENPPFDWENPATWEKVTEGINAVYITFQPDLAIPSAPSIIQQFTDVAKQNGVQQMVLLSGRGEKEAQVCEEIVKSNAKHWTIIRSSWFNQNFSEGFFLEPLNTGHIALPSAEVPEPFIDVDDIADVVTEALLDDVHNKQTYELTGPRLLTFSQAVAEIAKATGKEITFQPVSISQYISMLKEYEVPEDEIWLVNYLFTELFDGRNASTTNDIEKVLKRKPKDFSAYVKEAAASGTWNNVPHLQPE